MLGTEKPVPADVGLNPDNKVSGNHKKTSVRMVALRDLVPPQYEAGVSIATL
jgi:hypothetical protein